MKALFQSNKVWGILAETWVSSPSDAEEYQAAKQKAWHMIVLSIDVSLLHLIKHCDDDPVQAWKILRDRFQDSGYVHTNDVLYNFNHHVVEEDGDMEAHIAALRRDITEMRDWKYQMPDQMMAMTILRSLPFSYRTLITVLQGSVAPEDRTVDYVTKMVLDEYKSRKSFMKSKGQGGNAFKADVVPTSKRCRYCRTAGHIIEDCPKLKKKRNASPQDTTPDQVALHMNAAAIDNADDVCFMATISPLVQDQWIFDSGSSFHYTSRHDWLYSYEEYSPGLAPRIGSAIKGKYIVPEGYGKLKLNFINPHGQATPVVMENVQFSPEFKSNLFSQGAAMRKGMITISNSKGITLFTKSRRAIGYASLTQGNNFILHTSIPDIPSNALSAPKIKRGSLEIWHKRMGHLNYRSLSSMMQDCSDYNVVLDDNNKPLAHCDGCSAGKQTRNSFTGTSPTRSHAVMDLIHADTFGPVPTRSLGGNLYGTVVIDDYSRYGFCTLLATKDSVVPRIQRIKARMERSTGNKLKVFRSDQGTEFKKLDKTFELEGIKHEMSTTYTPEQNRIAERYIRTLVETARCLLFTAKLPDQFWAAAVKFAVYVRNRSPHKALDGATPFEKWYGTKPDLSDLHVFGCNAWSYIPKHLRSKFQPKARKCIFLGYSDDNKNYCLYEIDSGTIFYDCHVTFDESSLKDRFNGFLQQTIPSSSSNVSYIPLETFNYPDNTSDTLEYNVGPPHISRDDLPPNGAVRDIIDEELHCPSEMLSGECITPTTETPLRRTSRVSRPPGEYWKVHKDNEIPEANLGMLVSYSAVDTSFALAKPANLRTALDDPIWKAAMQAEFDSHMENGTWDLIDPTGMDIAILPCHWVHNVKEFADNRPNLAKSRLVAGGNKQVNGKDYDVTFSPVIRRASLNIIFAIVASQDLELHQMDVKTAFLNGHLAEDVYMSQPPGFRDPGHPNKICHLRRSIYGLKQSSRAWNKTMDEFLKQLQFQTSGDDPCLYVKMNGTHICIIGLYVDDLLMAFSTVESLHELKDQLNARFRMKDMGELQYFLGMEVKRDRTKRTLWLGQTKYIRDILERFNMSDCNPTHTPFTPGTLLTKADCPTDPTTMFTLKHENYRSIVGALLYIATCTRPDISYAVGIVAQFCENPGKPHITAAKRILRYLKQTMDLGIYYGRGVELTTLAGFADADWAHNPDTSRSISGLVINFGGAPILWRSKKQTSVALSTCEAEYVALSLLTQEIIWIRRLLEWIGLRQLGPTDIFDDNVGAILTATNGGTTSRLRHVRLRYHFVREQAMDAKSIAVHHVPSENQLADIFTKALPRPQFESLRSRISILRADGSTGSV
jgi:transposase InsO family protein